MKESKEDREDFKQEQLIQKWLQESGQGVVFEFVSTTRNNTARVLSKSRDISFDKPLVADSPDFTLHELVIGSDGRDLYEKEEIHKPEVFFSAYLFAMGFNQEETQWVTRTLKLSAQQSNWPYERFLIDSEWSIL